MIRQRGDRNTLELDWHLKVSKKIILALGANSLPHTPQKKTPLGSGTGLEDMCCAQIEVSCWTLLVPVSFMPTQLFSRASCWRCCSHNNWWGALLHRRVIKLGFAALAANAASQAGSHNAQDTGCPTEHHQVDEDDAKCLASTGPDLRCSYQSY